uniref:Uncharacterized protein n=1 Tax=viral metagenome TaxID=1070528 RepID=A0A6C0AF81_9ZZZZ
METSEALFEKHCGKIIRLKYPDYPLDSWGEGWVNTLKEHNLDYKDCLMCFIISDKIKDEEWKSHRHIEFRITFLFENDFAIHFNSDYGWIKYRMPDFNRSLRSYELNKNTNECNMYVK